MTGGQTTDRPVKYDIEADWKLLNACNFRCSYCFISPALLRSKMRRFATTAEWKAAFRGAGKTWLLHLTGGEPSIYFDFAALCRGLTEEHYISLNSNLTHGAIVEFARSVDPRRVSFINAGLHLEERETRTNHASFLRNADLLLAAGFPLFVSIVATPAALRRFDEAAALLRPLGLFPVPKLLRETYEGRQYPAAYTAAEKARFSALAEAARAFYGSAFAGRAERPSIDVFGDDAFVEGTPSYAGRSCEAGRRFVSIEPDGEVFRCSPKTGLGNLLSGTFAPLPEPAPCDTSYCFYFCQKYAAPPASAAA
jgi:MoaA/NifB/PqqE/SkfB family radical SAM enzyme